MTTQLALRQAMDEALSRAKIQNPHYSGRALAKRLEITPSEFSEILRGKRRVSLKKARHILDRIGLHPHNADQIIQSLQAENEENKNAKKCEDKDYKLLTFHAQKLISEWSYYAFLYLLETKDIKYSEEFYAKRLGISVREVREIIERLIELGLLKSEGKKLKPTYQKITTTDGIPNYYIRKAHGENLQMAAKALLEVDLERRDFSSMTMAIDIKKLKKAKHMITQFRRKLCHFLGDGDKDEVYKLSIQLFPLSKKV